MSSDAYGEQLNTGPEVTIGYRNSVLRVAGARAKKVGTELGIDIEFARSIADEPRVKPVEIQIPPAHAAIAEKPVQEVPTSFFQEPTTTPPEQQKPSAEPHTEARDLSDMAQSAQQMLDDIFAKAA